ncbi:NUDIX hydrolase [Virgibacillus halophilus]|uniref:NUDIX hydrolase n=1 Tax=Tigheibacillus halophilus TaxID=361280 RepID=UPI00363D7DB8
MDLQWLKWAKRIQAISQAGLAFSKDEFDRERYAELREISCDIIAKHTEMKIEDVKKFYISETGYPTPKVDVRGVIFQKGRLLFIKEKMDQRWALPGGFCEVGLSPAENVVKEIKEEAGFDTKAKKMLAVLDMNKYSNDPQPYDYYKLFILCDIVGGERTVGLETSDIQFFAEHDLPRLSTRRNTLSQIRLLFEFLHDPEKETAFD